MKLLEAEHNNKKFIIEEDYPEVGCYLYIYENGECIKDFLQDNVLICEQIAFEYYGVPLDKWKVENKREDSLLNH